MSISAISWSHLSSGKSATRRDVLDAGVGDHDLERPARARRLDRRAVALARREVAVVEVEADDVVVVGRAGRRSAAPMPDADAGDERDSLRLLVLANFPSRSLTTSGSRSVVTSPSSLPSAMSRSRRRMILPERVLGRSPDQMMRLGRASLPIFLATCSRISSTSSSEPSSSSPSSVTNAVTDWPESSSVWPMTAASATFACETIADSTSAVDMRWPETLMTSSTRPMTEK